MLCVTTFSTFVSGNSALGAERRVRGFSTRRGRSKSNYFEALKRTPDLCISLVFFTVRPQPLKQSKVASLGRRLHRVGHRNVTIPLKTRWLTPAGLCVSAQ